MWRRNFFGNRVPRTCTRVKWVEDTRSARLGLVRRGSSGSRVFGLTSPRQEWFLHRVTSVTPWTGSQSVTTFWGENRRPTTVRFTDGASAVLHYFDGPWVLDGCFSHVPVTFLCRRFKVLSVPQIRLRPEGSGWGDLRRQQTFPSPTSLRSNLLSHYSSCRDKTKNIWHGKVSLFSFQKFPWITPGDLVLD